MDKPDKLYKTVLTIWSSEDPSGLEIDELAREACSGDAFCQERVDTVVTDASQFPSTEFFGVDSSDSDDQPPLDPERPWVVMTLLTSDQCSRSDFYQQHGDDLVRYEGEWSPDEPDAEMDFVNMERHGVAGRTDDVEITGDVFRDLESEGLLDDFVSAYLAHGTLEAAQKAIGLTVESAAPSPV